MSKEKFKAKDLGAYVLNLDRCNQRCLFCMKKEDIEKNPDITEDRIIREILLAKKKGYDKLDFFGGEPLVFPFLKRMLILAQKFDMKCMIATNATLFFSPEFTEKFFHGLNVDHISVRTSMHSHKAADHDKITRLRGSHKKTVAGVKNILRFNQKISANIVITSLNYKDLSTITQFIYDLGLRGIKFSGLHMQGEIRNHPELLIAEERIKDYVVEAARLAQKLGFFHIEVEKVSKKLEKELKKIKGVQFIDTF